MSVDTIWNAAREGNAEALRVALDARKSYTTLGRRADNHGWTFLHHAAVSGSLECVQLIATRLIPDCEKRCHEGYTPLARACQRSAPLNIVAYLIKRRKSSINIGNNEDITPLHYAVTTNRLDLVELLVANGANANALDYADESPADTAAFDTGNISILIHLLFSAKSRCPDITVFSARANYEVAKKIAIFKILYNFKNPRHKQRQRYGVLDILRPALLSTRTQSLMPFFIETEMKWEKNETIRSLYELLSNPDYGVLAMLVWFEAKHSPTLDGSVLTDFSKEFKRGGTADAFAKLAHAGIVYGDESLELMARLISFLKVTKPIVGKCVRDIFIELIFLMLQSHFTALAPYQWDWRNTLRYQRVVDLLMPWYEGEIDKFVRELVRDDTKRMLKFVLPFIGYCSYLFMCPRRVYGIRSSDTAKILWRSIGTLPTQKVFFRIFPCFSLKRLARDTVRMAVFKGVGKPDTPGHTNKFIHRLESLDVPEVLKSYLKYRDSETVNDLSASSEPFVPGEDIVEH